MADFPSSPTVGSTFTGSDGTSWTWDGYSWVAGSALGILYENGEIIAKSYSVGENRKAFSIGTITIAEGATITIANNSYWEILDRFYT